MRQYTLILFLLTSFIFFWAPTPATAGQTPGVIEFLDSIKADPQARQAAEKALLERIQSLRPDPAETPLLDAKRQELEALRKEIKELSSRLEETRGRLTRTEEEICALESKLATTQAPAEDVTLYEQALALIQALSSPPPAEPLQAATNVPAEPAAQFTAEQQTFFEKRILSILEENCTKCHGPEKQKAGLRVDLRECLLQGGESGPAIIPGKPAGSLLIQAIRQEGDLKMPPNSKLDDDAINALCQWVALGAPWPSKAPAAPGAGAPPPPEAPPAPQPRPAAPAPAVAAVDLENESAIVFNRDIRPVLSNTCFACHGPDEKKRKAGLRLDIRSGAFIDLGGGVMSIVPGKKEDSEVWRRITSTDPEEAMPPKDAAHRLTEKQITLIGQWIDEGAEWQEHWSFEPIRDVEPPQVTRQDWIRNPIDNFILKKLEEKGIEPSPEADKHALIRRVTLDLTGLPPTIEEVEAFVSDESPDAYEKVVDRLLDSPRYGEHMARYWLDLARYADTNGYHIDNERYMWRWRDWVIDAFNHNIPFDQFTMWQLAGDLLPNPTREQLIATGFNRNHMINFEGGAIPEEYQTQYVIDRVDTTSTVWLGLTMACVQCHEHKYDPFSQKEFYQLYAFFNTIPEEGLDGRDGNAKPFIQAPLPGQEEQLAALRQKIAEQEAKLDAPMPSVDAAQANWETEWAHKLAERWTLLDMKSRAAQGGAELAPLEDGSIIVRGENPAKDVYEIIAQTSIPVITGIRLETLVDDSTPAKGTGRSENGNFVLSEFTIEVAPASNPDTFRPLKIAQANADFSQPNFDITAAIDGKPETGWAVEGFEKHENRTAIFAFESPLTTGNGSILRIKLHHESEFDHHSIARFRLAATNDPALSPSSLGPWYINGPYVAESGAKAYETDFTAENGPIDLDAKYPDGRMKWMRLGESFQDGKIQTLFGEVCATYLYREIISPSARNITLAIGSNDAVKIWLNGAVVHDNNVQRGVKPDQDKVALTLNPGKNELLVKVVNYGGQYAFYFNRQTEQTGEIPLDIELILAKAAGARSETEASALRRYYRRLNSPQWQEEDKELARLKEEAANFEKQIPTVMIMQEMEEPRPTFVLARGQYDQPTDRVYPAVPHALPPLPEGAPNNRLGFAQWLVSPEHPLTARVIINRFWLWRFGQGIVKTAEDFGAQGEWPSHPALLDWLAKEFIRSGWDIKHIQRLMVTSAAYRQSSKFRPELMETDPENRLLARGPRFRMDAEMVRDNALAVSGLLVEQIGGPSVKPYQPPGLWEEVAYGAGFTAQTFKQDEGDKNYRRSMYTFWKRQAPPPNMMLFDAPNRETCTSRRARANTPLQALSLLNDPQFVEAARAFAQRIMTQAGPTPSERVTYAFRLATARPPSQKELAILLNIYEKQYQEFASDADAAEKYLSVGAFPCDPTLDKCEMAAWTTVASAILNLDETMTKS